MDLRKALAVLSRSSPFAVTTSGEIVDPKLRALKQYLYVATDVENAFKEKLGEIKPGEIVFLCGSSGDGKSEILTRYQQEYSEKVTFHLDATHSFEPDRTAIDTLNDVFEKQQINRRPLVVGINIGMLANYEREGSENHKEIKQAIQAFIADSVTESGGCTFIDFEAFPKFSIEDNGRIMAPFFSALLDRVVIDDQRNGFREYFNSELGKAGASLDTKKIVANYLLLRDRGVQKVIIELLLNARIRQDQFVTARMLLDFIYCILTGPKYLFDNLFDGGDNELLHAVAEFDPSVIRNRELDLFVLNRTLGIEDGEYKNFRDEARERFRIDSRGKVKPESLVRQLYVLRYSTSLKNKYTNNFKQSFEDPSELAYRRVWSLHKTYSGGLDDKKQLKDFYDKVVFAAITSYANRNAPYLSKDEFYLSSHGGCDIASEVEITVSYKDIEDDKCGDIHSFNLYLKANDEKLDPLPVNVNLLSLMMDVVSGYRPNRYDKNSVVMLDELVNHITNQVSCSDVLYLFKRGRRLAKVRNNVDGDIRVSGL